MHHDKLNHSDEVKKLTEELNVYKTVLNTIDNHDIVEDLTTIMKQNEQMMEKMMSLKGDLKKMNENNEKERKEYEQREDHISIHMQTLDESFAELKADFQKVVQKIDHLKFTELLEKVNDIIDQHDETLQAKKEIEELKHEMKQLQQKIASKADSLEKQTTEPQTSEFRRLQNMLKSQNQQVMTSEPVVSRNNTMKTKGLINQYRQNASIGQRVHTEQRNAFQTFGGENKNIITRVKLAEHRPAPPSIPEKVEQLSSTPERKTIEEKQEIVQQKEKQEPSTETYEDQVGATEHQHHQPVQPTNQQSNREEKSERQTLFSFFRKG